MPTPPHPGPDDSPTTAADDTVDWAPVNVARPQWACPHCEKNHRDDYDAAQECAAAGPAPAHENGTPVLMLSGYLNGRHRAYSEKAAATAEFGLTEVGPVTAVRVDGTLEHQRSVIVNDRQLHPLDLSRAKPAGDGLLVLADERDRRDVANIDANGLWYTHGTFAKLFLETDYGRVVNDVPVWCDATSSRRDDDVLWWRTPNIEERAALNVCTNGLLDRIVDIDTDELTAAIRATYSANHRRQRTETQRPEELAAPHGGLVLAEAYDAPNHVWALRWLVANLDQVSTWQAAALQTWAAGTSQTAEEVADGAAVEDGVIIPAVPYLRASDSLPKNPGKRRLAVMEAYGYDYRSTIDRLIKRLAATAPENPVPGTISMDAAVGRTTNPEGN